MGVNGRGTQISGLVKTTLKTVDIRYESGA